MRTLFCLTVVMIVMAGCGSSPQATGDTATPKSSAPKVGETAGGELSLTLTMSGTNETVNLQPSTKFTKQVNPTNHHLWIHANTEGITITTHLELGSSTKLVPGEYQRADNRPEMDLFWRHPDKAKAQEGWMLFCKLQGAVTVSAVHPDRTFDGSVTVSTSQVSTPQDCWLGIPGKGGGYEYVSELGQVSLTGTFTKLPMPKGVD
jgi:hypothetical protein